MVVRTRLAAYNKRLDESLLNNQLKVLTSKRDAHTPLYLALACECLRVNARQYEALDARLKQLPARLASLVEHLLDEIETSYGRSLTAAAFAFVCCARNGHGLFEHELRRLVELYLTLSTPTTTALDSIAKCDSLLSMRDTLASSLATTTTNNNSTRATCGTAHFLSFVDVVVKAFGEQRCSPQAPIRLRRNALIQAVIHARYASTSISFTTTSSRASLLNASLAHRLMAVHYLGLVESSHVIANGTTTTTTASTRRIIQEQDVRALTCLPWHLARAGCASDLIAVLCDLRFLDAKCANGLGAQLMQDFDFAAAATSQAPNNSSNKRMLQVLDASTRFADYKSFVVANCHVLVRPNANVYQQALNEPRGTQPARDARALLRRHESSSSRALAASFLFERLGQADDKNKQPNSSSTTLVINQFDSEAVSAVAIAPDAKMVACGTESGIGTY